MISTIVVAQSDTSMVDSLILQGLVGHAKQVDSVKQVNAVDTVKEVPVDPELLNFYLKKGVQFDSACSMVELYREVYSWLGVRYKYAGLTKRGVDCAGFVKNICNAVYGCNLAGSARDHFKRCVPIEREELQEGDLVFFKINQSQISHVGLYLGNGKFVHAAVHGGVMINDLSEKYYNKYYYISGRLINAPNKPW